MRWAYRLAPLRFLHRSDIAFTEMIEPYRVVVKHFLFNLVGEILPRHQMRQVAAELVTLPLVGEIRSPHEHVGAEQVYYIGSGALFDLHGNKDVAGLEEAAGR